jgi:oligopeptide transport system substrate-binding protein
MRHLFLILILTLFSSLSGGTRTLNIPFSTDISSLDPRVGSDFPTSAVMHMMYEGLMRYDVDGNIVLALAKSYSVSEDELTYIFHLRPSTWTNGENVTAFDFEYAWKKGINPKTADRASYYFYPVKNAQACLEGNLDIETVGVKALDSSTLKVDLQYPTPYFLEMLATITNYLPISKKVDEESPSWRTAWEKQLVSNGAFNLKKWTKDYQLSLVKNPLYWDRQAVKLPGINIYIIQDGNTAFNMFCKKDLDWIGDPICSIPDDVIKPDEVEKKETITIEMIVCNTQKPPFNNKNFRKAIAHAINRDEVSRTLYSNGQKKPITGLFAGALRLNQNNLFEDGNTGKAKDYLKKALLEMNTTIEKLPPIVFKSRANSSSSFPEYLQETLRKELGLCVEIEKQDFVSHFAKIRQKDYQFGELGWTSYAKDQTFFLTPWYSKTEKLNMMGWESNIFQYLVDKAIYEKNREKRNLYLELAEEVIIEEMPLIPIFNRVLVFQRNPKLKDVFLSETISIDFRYAAFED